jgi:hypothetical protein
MNRRGFLSVLAGAAAAIIVPELLVPKRTFFLPPVGGWDVGAFTSGWGSAIPYKQPDPALFALLKEIGEQHERFVSVDTASMDGDFTVEAWFKRDLSGNLLVDEVRHYAPMRLHDRDLKGVTLTPHPSGWTHLALSI